MISLLFQVEVWLLANQGGLLTIMNRVRRLLDRKSGILNLPEIYNVYNVYCTQR